MLKTINKTQKLYRGDTIIEVLIAIAVAAFAIGTSYAIANKSLNRAIAARERNEALNIVQNQITDLKLRYKNTDEVRFNQYFTVPASVSAPATAFHFCLLDSASDPQDDATWLPQMNNISSDSQAETLSSTYYNDANGNTCIHRGSVDYYVDISAMVTTASDRSKNRTVYKVVVRWAEPGSGRTDSSVVYYRLGGYSGITLGASTDDGSILPPSSTTVTADFAVMQATNYTSKYSPPSDPPHLIGSANGVQFLDCIFYPSGVGVNSSCGTYQNDYPCDKPVPGTTFTDNPPTDTWDSSETCSLYHADWTIPVDPGLLQTLDFEFTNDRWDFPDPSFDNNILIFGLSVPSPHQVKFGYYCQVTPNPPLPAYGSTISSSSLLPLFWDGYTAHLFIDGNTPNGGNCT
ncbi:hypothetical protein KW801_00910 [Candidatus Saccharibacteria bacterium]|nr:hypothetical protein [Candidatus Saccharibacteria bacterium]